MAIVTAETVAEILNDLEPDDGAPSVNLRAENERLRARVAKLEETIKNVQEVGFPYRISTLDIECTNLKANFGFILCVSIKDLGNPDVKTFRIDRYPGYSKAMWNDCQLVEDVRKELQDIDWLLTYNGTRFDMKFLDTRAVYWGNDPMPPILHQDVLNLTRYRLLLHSNRLDSVISFLQTSAEKTHLEPDIWIKASHGDVDCMNYIVEHCEKDVLALEQVFLRSKGLIRNIFKRR